jgi:hypothetical protein
MPILKNTKHQAVRLAYSRDPENTGWDARRKVFARQLQHTAETHEEAAKSPIASPDEVLEELSKIARVNVRDLMRVGANGDLVPDFNNLTREQAAAITAVKVKSSRRGSGKDAREVCEVTFKFHDKLRALKMLGQYYGLFNGRQSSDDSDVAERLKEASMRVDGKKTRNKSDRIVTRHELKMRAEL